MAIQLSLQAMGMAGKQEIHCLRLLAAIDRVSTVSDDRQRGNPSEPNLGGMDLKMGFHSKY